MTATAATPFAFLGGLPAVPLLLLVVVFDFLLIRGLARTDRRWISESIALILAQSVAVGLVAAFFTSGQLGSGDSYHYGLQLADFLAQLREGVFPVLVGQSEFGFNGNIHTLRTAPYYVHLGGVLHTLTGAALPVFAVKNLCVIFSAVGGVSSAYAAIRVLAPDWRWAAPLLAGLYILCPMHLVALIGMDMYATFMTLPWLPLFWLGVIGLLHDGHDDRFVIIGTAALIITWYAHPAIGVWLTPFWAGALVVGYFHRGRSKRDLIRALLSIGAVAWLLVFLFVSVSSLELNYSTNAYGLAGESIVRNLREAWPAAWMPLAKVVANLGNLQLGYALAAVAVGCVIAVPRTRLPGAFVTLCVGTLLFLLLPIPVVAQALWSKAPDALINATNVWPMQRFYPIIAAAIPLWAALSLRAFTPSWRSRLLVFPGLFAGLGWGTWQILPILDHTWLVRQTPAASAEVIAPVNVTLTRSSYLLFELYPAYYSHGTMEPTFETRLLDRAMQPVLENASALFAAKSPTVPIAILEPAVVDTGQPDERRREATFSTDGHSHYLLAFEFKRPVATGIIQLFGAGVRRLYFLPEFGSPLAFGAGLKSSPLLPICLPPGPPGIVTLRTELTDIKARVYAFQPAELPIQTRALIPLKINLHVAQSGFVETPRVFIPGYRATVNGAKASVVRSAEGLVAVRVEPGSAEITVRYDGPIALRVAFWFSFVGFMIVPIAGAWAWRQSRPIPSA